MIIVNIINSTFAQQRQTKSLEELEVHYEDEKNSMIAISETGILMIM